MCYLGLYHRLYHQPRTSHEYRLCNLAMFMVSSKDLEHVNQPSLGLIEMCGPLGMWSFSEDVVIKLATSLTM